MVDDPFYKKAMKATMRKLSIRNHSLGSFDRLFLVFFFFVPLLLLLMNNYIDSVEMTKVNANLYERVDPAPTTLMITVNSSS
ncbi:MAG: hypothetical protein ACFFCQ_00445 [Promethearchaeota archaeon]